MSSTGDLIHVVSDEDISDAAQARLGRILIRGSFLVLLRGRSAPRRSQALGVVDLGFANWQPTLFAYVAWCVCLCVGQVLIRGEQGKRILFVLPAALFVVSLTVIPLAARHRHRLRGLEPLVARPARSSPASATSSGCCQTPSTGTRSPTWCGTRWRSSSSTPSPSAWRCCSARRSGRAASSAWRSCCRSCCRRWPCRG